MHTKNSSLTIQLERLKENYQVSKQILLETLTVKLKYEKIIQNSLQDSELSQKMLQIIKSLQATTTTTTDLPNTTSIITLTDPKLQEAKK